MRELEHLGEVAVVRWPNIPPGSVVLSGFTLNGAVPPELAQMPALTAPLIEDLVQRYRLNPGRRIIIARPSNRLRGVHLSKELRTLRTQLDHLRSLVGEFHTERQKLLSELDPDHTVAGDDRLWTTPLTETERLVKDQYNSFTVRIAPDAQIPSFLDQVWTGLSLGEMLLGSINQKGLMPDDPDVTVHVVLDCSNSMRVHDKNQIAVNAVNRLADGLAGLFANATIKRYVFSDTARRVDGPLTGREVRPGETSYAAAFKKVLHFRAAGRNKVFLITDGIPTDHAQSVRAADLLARQKVDYTQILLHSDGELEDSLSVPDGSVDALDGVIEGDIPSGATKLTAAEVEQFRTTRFERFTEIAEHAGGNQVVLTVYRALRLISLELYDRYVGLLTLARRNGAL